MPRSDRVEDPRGLIQESYRIDGITLKDCRTIFFDWAVGVPDGEDMRAHVRTLYAHYAAENPDHPMTEVLLEGFGSVAIAKRRKRR